MKGSSTLARTSHWAAEQDRAEHQDAEVLVQVDAGTRIISQGLHWVVQALGPHGSWGGQVYARKRKVLLSALGSRLKGKPEVRAAINALPEEHPKVELPHMSRSIPLGDRWGRER